MKKLLEPVTKIELDEAFDKYDEKNRSYKDEILTGLDKVMKELETIREDNTIGAHQTEEMAEKVENHEQRISNLETPV